MSQRPSRIGVVRSVGGEPRLVDAFGDGRALRRAHHPVGTWLQTAGPDNRVLAPAGSALADLYALAAREGIGPLHSPAAMAEAEAFVADPGIDDPELEDLRHLPLVTIDEVHSRDLDQAVAIERAGDGFTLWHALADASHFVRPGLALYDEALERGASFYLPGLVLPMLPAVLSEDLVSLNPDVDRRALVFELSLDTDGRCVGRRLHRARVRSRYKLAFDGVQAFLDGGEVDWSAEVRASLRLLPEVGSRRMRLAEERSVVRYRRAEVDVKIADRRFVALDGPRNDVERYNEQISLLTNMEGARFLIEQAPEGLIQPIFRVHEPPGPERFEALRATTAALARRRGLDAAEWVWDPDTEPLGLYLDRLPDSPVAHAIHRQAMIANRPSHYASAPGVHYGVGAEVYGRFTAPMREIVGIFLHSEAFEKLAGEAFPVPGGYEGPALRERVLTSANRSRERQRKLDRDANRLVLDDLFAGPAETRAGTVLGLTPSRVHVQLDAPRVDVKLYRRHLEADWGPLTLDADGIALLDGDGAERVCLGERVRVRVAGRDSRRDRWDLRLVGESDAG